MTFCIPIDIPLCTRYIYHIACIIIYPTFHPVYTHTTLHDVNCITIFYTSPRHFQEIPIPILVMALDQLLVDGIIVCSSSWKAAAIYMAMSVLQV